MGKRIITISRQCGSGGHTIGEQLAERLKMPFYDKKIMEIVARRSGLSDKTVTEQGSCVIVGRCANYILKDYENSFHVFICGAMKNRINRIVSGHCVPIEKAEAHIIERDKKRARHYNHYTDQIWGIAENYNLCLDSSYFGLDLCADIIADNVLV